MNTFKSRNHGFETSTTFNTSVYSTICHLTNHLTIVQIQQIVLDEINTDTMKGINATFGEMQCDKC